MEGRKFVVLLLAAVVILSIVTFTLYLLTRDEDYMPPTSRLSNDVPGVTRYSAAPAYEARITSVAPTG